MNYLDSKPGGVFLFDNINDVSIQDRFVIVEVYKTGEKAAGAPFNKRGRKPQGYQVYKNGSIYAFLPYGDRPKFSVKK